MKPIIVGHRGASGYEPENTLRSFKRAMDMGVQMIELDLYLCKSEELVVIHDDTIDRTTNGTGKVKELTWNELKTFNAGKGERIPLLSEVFDLVNKRLVINIDLKDAQAVRPLADLIMHYIKNKNWTADKFLLSAFDHKALHEFHKYCPTISIAPIFDNCPTDLVNTVKKLKSNCVVVNHECVTKKLIENIHSLNIKIFTYTVNQKPLAEKLEKIHIDGIITDFPDIMRH